MSTEGNKALVRQFMQAYNDRRMEVFEELVAADYIDHVFDQTGRDALRSLFTLAFDGFPDWYEAIEDIIAEDDRVWVRVRATGTHTGDWDLLGAKLPATGKSVVLNMVFIWRIADGQLAEGWEVDDNLDFLKELGVVEYTEFGRPLEEVFR